MGHRSDMDRLLYSIMRAKEHYTVNKKNGIESSLEEEIAERILIDYPELDPAKKVNVR